MALRCVANDETSAAGGASAGAGAPCTAAPSSAPSSVLGSLATSLGGVRRSRMSCRGSGPQKPPRRRGGPAAVAGAARGCHRRWSPAASPPPPLRPPVGAAALEPAAPSLESAGQRPRLGRLASACTATLRKPWGVGTTPPRCCRLHAAPTQAASSCGNPPSDDRIGAGILELEKPPELASLRPLGSDVPEDCAPSDSTQYTRWSGPCTTLCRLPSSRDSLRSPQAATASS